MSKYEFTLILLSDPSELTDEIADTLYRAGCDDGTPGTYQGKFVIDFSRKAKSLEEAISSAIANVRTAGHDVSRVEMEAAVVASA